MGHRRLGVWGSMALLVIAGLACATVRHEDVAVGREDAAEQATAVPAGSQPAPKPETPEAGEATVRWRLDAAAIGAGEDDLSFSTVTGMDATASLLLVTDAYGGISGFDLDGSLAMRASPGVIGYVSDVAVGPDGRLYMADSALHQVTIFDSEGGLLGGFGSLGQGDGELGGDSPRALAVSPAGEVFVLDPNSDATGAPVLRVQVFDPEGGYLRSFPLAPAWDVRAMDVGPDGTLYVVGLGGFLGELEPEAGRLIQQLGREILAAAGPQSVAVDDAGYLYLATQAPAAVAVLDPLGDLVCWIGEEGVRTEEGWDVGTFLFPSVVAVTPDGRTIFVGDAYEPFVYVTAMSR